MSCFKHLMYSLVCWVFGIHFTYSLCTAWTQTAGFGPLKIMEYSLHTLFLLQFHLAFTVIKPNCLSFQMNLRIRALATAPRAGSTAQLWSWIASSLTRPQNWLGMTPAQRVSWGRIAHWLTSPQKSSRPLSRWSLSNISQTLQLTWQSIEWVGEPD